MVVRTEFIKKRCDIKLQFIVGNKTINEKIKKEPMKKLIYVENKPPMSYVLSFVTPFNNDGSEEIVIKLRSEKNKYNR